MGCCASTSASSSHESPYTGTRNATSSSRAINTSHYSSNAQQPQSQPRPSTARSSSLSRPNRISFIRGQSSLSDHVNQPLKLHIWKCSKSSSKRRWTSTEIDVERVAFFDTRVTGRPEIWQVLRNICDMISTNMRSARISGGAVRSRELKEQMKETLESADVILRAAEITLPTGDLVDGVYDVLGGLYELPEWVVADPEDLAEETGTVADESDKKIVLGEDDETVDDDDGSAARRREEKGKTVLLEEDLMKVVVKLTEGPEKVVVKIGKGDSVRLVGRRVLEEAGLRDKSIKLMYMGKMLKDTDSLLAQNWKEDHAINAFIFAAI